MEKKSYVFHDGNGLQISFPQFCESLNRRLDLWNNKGLHHYALSEKCRIHNTYRHNELECLDFLDKIEMILQRGIFMQNFPEPLASIDLGFIDATVEAFMEIVEDQLGGGRCLQYFISSKWCRVHNATHSEFTCRSCVDAIIKVGRYLEWKEKLDKECTTKRPTNSESRNDVAANVEVALEGTEYKECKFEASKLTEEHLSEELPMEIKKDVLVEVC